MVNLFAYRRPALVLLVVMTLALGLTGIQVFLGYFPWQANAFPPDGSWKMVQAARMLGIVVLVLITMQILLVSRIPVLNNLFGLHALVRGHKIMAGILVATATSHALLIIGSRVFTSSIFSSTGLARLVGMVAIILLACGAGIAFFRKTLAIPYHLWSMVHGPIMIIGTCLVFLHAFTVGQAVSFRPRYLFLLSLMAIILGSLGWKMFFRPALINRHIWLIRAIAHPCPDVIDMHIASTECTPWPYHAGQFVFLTFLDPGLPREAHPFTIASGPSPSGTMRFLIRQCGDFTARLSQLRPGTNVLVEGPFGVFSPFFRNTATPHRPMVFLAGGIGITPFLAILDDLSRNQSSASILLGWSVKTGQELFAAQDLAGFQKSIKGLQLHYFVTRDFTYQGCTCRMTTQRLRPLLEEWTNALVFVCGPPGMTRSTTKSLTTLGFASNQIITETFSL